MPTFGDVLQALENNDTAVRNYQIDLRRFLESAARTLARKAHEEAGGLIRLDPIKETSVHQGTLTFTLRPELPAWGGYGDLHKVNKLCQGRIWLNKDRHFVVSFFAQEPKTVANETEFSDAYLESFIEYSNSQRQASTGQ